MIVWDATATQQPPALRPHSLKSRVLHFTFESALTSQTKEYSLRKHVHPLHSQQR